MTANNMKPQGRRRRRRTGTPSLRGLQGRSATGRDGQAAKEELSAIWGAGCRENNSGVPAGKSVFHLTSPFIGLSHSLDGGDKVVTTAVLENPNPEKVSLSVD
jgi:murein tripeptide amidase MpaA